MFISNQRYASLQIGTTVFVTDRDVVTGETFSSICGTVIGHIETRYGSSLSVKACAADGGRSYLAEAGNHGTEVHIN